jgi:phosphatidylserine/phosphatidylglycerophosphate/cardiolipin synthase-like enzyme
MAAFLVVAVLGACRADSGNGDDVGDPDGGADAASSTCETTPRTTAPETFVGPTGLQERLTALIDGAHTTLDIQMYLWTVKALADRVVAAKQRGVTVRVILDPDEAGNDAVRPRLAAGEVPTRDATALFTYAHAKYMVIDGSAAVIMSMNFNADAMDLERNYGLVDRDPDDVADVAAIFTMDWALAGAEPPQPADLDCTRLVVSPNNSKARLLALINGATSTLDVEVMYLADDDVRTAVGAATQRGVAVRVILDPDQDTPDDVTYLKGLGITVKAPSSSQFLLHAKLIIADGVAFVGSENMSVTSLTKNREVGVLVYEPGAAAPIQAQFESDWNATQPL